MSRTNPNPGTRRRFYARYLAGYAKKNRVLLIFGALFTLGVFIGALLLRSAGEGSISLLESVVGGFIERRRASGLYENVVAAFSSSMLFAALLFVFGFCAIAQPLIVAAPFIRGLGFGFSAASLFAAYGASAIGFVGVLLLPGMVFSTVAILLCCRQALRLSGAFFASMARGGAQPMAPYSLRAYCLSFAAAALICLAGAFLEAILYFIFANSFILG